MSNKYYEKGKKAKELLNIYNNRYPKGSYEYEQWDKGFREGVYEPMSFDSDGLDGDCEFIDQCQPLYVEPRITKDK